MIFMIFNQTWHIVGSLMNCFVTLVNGFG